MASIANITRERMERFLLKPTILNHLTQEEKIRVFELLDIIKEIKLKEKADENG